MQKLIFYENVSFTYKYSLMKFQIYGHLYFYPLVRIGQVKE